MLCCCTCIRYPQLSGYAHIPLIQFSVASLEWLLLVEYWAHLSVDCQLLSSSCNA